MFRRTNLTYRREILILFFISITNLDAVYDSDNGNCFFDDWSLGECKPVLECPELLSQLRARERPTIVSCGFDGVVQIACCSMPLPVETTTAPVPESPSKINVLGRSEEKCQEYVRSMPGSIATQIIGGAEATLGEFPHMVALGYSNGVEIEFDCGGTLISDRFVVTAAHCVILKGRDPPILGRVGTVDLHGNFDKKDTDYYIEDVIHHPEYKTYRYYHDIALLKFNRTVTFTSLVFPACLNNNNEDPSSLMHVTGWGSTSLDKVSKSQYLKKGSVSSVNLVSCNTTLTKVKEFKLPVGLISGQICAMDKNFIMDTCGGDSGGPLQIPYSDSYVHKIIGVTSFGKACSGGIPAVYTRISTYLEWIEDHVWPIDR